MNDEREKEIESIREIINEFHRNKYITYVDFEQLIVRCLTADCEIFLQGSNITIKKRTTRYLEFPAIQDLIDKNLVDMYFNNFSNQLMLYSNRDLKDFFKRKVRK